MDCGPTCLRMVAKYYGRSVSSQTLRDRCFINKTGVSLLAISEAAESIGFQTQGVQLSFQDLVHNVTLPCIVHWESNHFVVVHKITRSAVYVADPAVRMMEYSHREFLAGWAGGMTAGVASGISLLLAPTDDFTTTEDDTDHASPSPIKQLFRYLAAYKGLVFQLVLGLLCSSLLQLALPFLTQAIVDVGVSTRNLNFIYLIVAAQFMLFFGRTAVDFIRSWVLLHISTRISLTILTGFISKLMQLPLSFFDTKHFGDILQRLSDHSRIQNFLTSNSLNVLFSLFNLLIFGIVLFAYDARLFTVFLAGSALYTGWIVLFLKKRKNLDYKKFSLSAKEQSSVVALINGMQEIKMANAELAKRWEWQRLQAKLFKLNTKQLSVDQYQQSGALFFNEGKNLLITFFSAKAVIEGEMTLGAMLAVQYIVGQLNSPVEQLIQFLQAYQYAKTSVERLNEVHQLADEEPAEAQRLTILPHDLSIRLKGLSFQYAGVGGSFALQDVNLHIPHGKTTAIVGMSGSGKTTLLKLLLKFYEQQAGDISVGGVNLAHISHRVWRAACGTVLQDGFIFSDTIARNIAVSGEDVEFGRLLHACEVANIREFIESLPLGFQTKIGAEGSGISQGQRQRILIARAVYKNPEYIFFDEATNALDANNESTIITNLQHFFQGRTAIIVAHRLSTVQHADQIIVMYGGRVVEQGSHYELLCREGEYYQLVRNQLQLGGEL